MSSFYGPSSSKGTKLDRNFTQLTITGGRKADATFPNMAPDLTVYGGARFGKTCIFNDDIRVKGNETINGNIHIIRKALFWMTIQACLL